LFQEAFKDVAEQLLQESGHIEKPAAAAPRTITVYKPLPRCDTHTQTRSTQHTGSKQATTPAKLYYVNVQEQQQQQQQEGRPPQTQWHHCMLDQTTAVLQMLPAPHSILCHKHPY
jgi:hypothetical protein